MGIGAVKSLKHNVLFFIPCLLLTSCAIPYTAPNLDSSTWVQAETIISKGLAVSYRLPPEALVSQGCGEKASGGKGYEGQVFCAVTLGEMPSAYGHILFLDYSYGQLGKRFDGRSLTFNSNNWNFETGLSERGTPYSWAYTNLADGNQMQVRAYSTREIGNKETDALVLIAIESVEIFNP